MQLIKSSKTALLFGSTGLVGNELLHQLLNESAYTRVIAPTRRPHHLKDEKLENPVVDFSNLESFRGQWTCDDVYISLGTTLKKAGSKEAFRRVDYDYIVQAAELAKANGATQCLLVSSVGANPDSLFLYPRVKGETEEAVKEIGFWATHIFRPGTLLGNRDEFRLMEKIGAGVSSFLRDLSPGILGDYNPTKVEVLARKMIEASRGVDSGVRIHSATDLLADSGIL